MNKFYLGVLTIVLSTMGFGVMPIFAVFAYKSDITVSTLLIIRFIAAAAILFGYYLLRYGSFTVCRKELFSLMLLGGICYTLQSTLYFTSVKLIPASLVSLILYAYPMLVALLSYLINREKLSKDVVISMILCFAGIILIVGASPGNLNVLGAFLAFAAAIVYAVYIILGDRIVKQLPPLLVTAFLSVFAAVGLIILGLIRQDISFDFDNTVWLPLAGITLFSTIGAILTLFKGIELLGPTKASILSMLEPVFTTVLSYLILGDRLGGLQIAGGAAVLGGAYLVVRGRMRESRSE